MYRVIRIWVRVKAPVDDCYRVVGVDIVDMEVVRCVRQIFWGRARA